MNPAVNLVMYPNSKNVNSYAEGMEFQDFVVEQFNKWGFYIQLHTSKKYQYERGESVQRAEIKLDKRCGESKKLSIEVGERTALDRPWVASGIYASDEVAFYIQGCRTVLFLFDRKVLVRYHQQKENGKFLDAPIGAPTIRKFYMPFSIADRCCIAKLFPVIPD